MRSLVRLSLLVLGLLSLEVRPSHAYVRETTKSGKPVFWRNPCITMHLYLGEPPPVLTADAYFAAATQAAALWSFPYLACTDIRLAVVAEPQAMADTGYDRKNVIVFRQDSWCRHPPPPPDADPPEAPCYSISALAVTTLFKNKNTGELLDTDIEFNAVNYAWGDLAAKSELVNATTADFQYALTHEFGHVIGLDHDSVAASIMYPSIELQSDKPIQRTLDVGDILGDCEMYRHVHDVCPPPASDTSLFNGCNLGAQAQLQTRHPWRNALAALVGVLFSIFALPRLRRRKTKA